MWISFIQTMLVALLVLYVPGISLLHTARVRNSYSVLLAPLGSIFLLEVIGEICAFAHLPLAPAGLWVIATLSGLILGALIGYGCKEELKFPDIYPLASGAYILAGLIGLYVVYISAVSSPADFCQSVDMGHHINTTQSMIDGSVFSSVFQSTYMAPADHVVNPWHGGGFYPSVYHIVGALVASMAGVSNAVALNALNAALCSVAYPLTALAFMGYILDGKKLETIVGALFVVALPCFPWDYITYGPLYPNLMGFSLMVLEAVAFMKCCEPKISKVERSLAIGLFCMGGVSLALTHPSTIFFLAIFLMPYCMDRIICFEFKDVASARCIMYKVGACVLLLAVWMGFFIGLYNTGLVQKMATFDWGITSNVKHALYFIFTASYMGHFYCAPSAFVVAFFLILGILYTLYDRRYLWISVSYIILCVALYINATSDSWFKHFIGSFWYTDPLRFASMAGIVGVILASLGLAKSLSFIKKKITSQKVYRSVVGVLCTLIAAVCFLPIDVEGWYGSAFPLATAHANIERSMGQTLYTPEKAEFIRKSHDIVSDDDVVANVPFDGSKFVYGADGMRMLYRSHTGFSEESNEKYDSKLIREGLKDYLSDQDVAHAVKTMGVKYAMVLNAEEFFADLDDEAAVERRKKFAGILDIDENTPGFELVLSDGDFKLYKLTGLGE